ncbi:TetR/AcrR family transcriptional regulator [Myxococcota bacterium]|nr:TetR/AcrR family transcriptional regulator [Myxococcota bacterium]MBU1897963.1 TetR/AcrR family transcriptional regulator [Myxococcota bacterium]
MPRPRLVSNEHILEIARACFLEHGHQVSTAFIAERVGLSQSALFKRFGSKEQLFLQAMTPPKRPPWVDLLDAGPDARPLYTQLVEVTIAIDHFLEFLVPLLATLHAARITPHCLVDRDQPPPEIGRRALVRWLKRAIAAERLAADFDAEAFSYAYVGGLSLRRFLHQIADTPLPEPIEDYAPRHVRQLGIARVEAEASIEGVDPQRGDH